MKCLKPKYQHVSTSIPIILCVAAGLLVASCGSDDPIIPDAGIKPDLTVDWGGTRTDLGPLPDYGQPCTLGTPNTCKTCDDVCPGTDDDSTVRTCVNSTCGINCKGEYYDVDGKGSTGCEVKDDTPLHNTSEIPIDLGDITDDNEEGGQYNKALIPSDNRAHLSEPVDRSNGIPDYYTVHIEDTIGYYIEPYFRLDLTEMTGDIQLTVSVSYYCDNEDVTDPVTQTATFDSGEDGQDNEFEMDVDACSPGFGTDGSGTALIEVRKTGGTDHSGQEYILVYAG